MKFATVIVSFLLFGCSTSMEYSQPSINDETDSFVEYTDKKARAANLSPLRKQALKMGHKEIRIWVGFGVVSPEDLLILNIDDKGKVSGRKILVYEKDPSNWEGDLEEFEYFLDNIYSRCTIVGKYKYIESCSLKHNEIFDWNKIYEKLKALDVWLLPDESKLPKPEIVVVDGFSMVVELSDGNSYRAYSYGNPAFRSGEEALKASEIMSFVMSL